MSEDGLQLFQLQGRGNAEHALVAVETAVRHEDVGVICAVKLFALPVLLWAITAWLAPELALSVLLLSGVSTVVTAPFIATILDASPNRMLQVTVLTSVLVPLTLPGLVSLLMGQSLEIPYSHMARLLAVVYMFPYLLILLPMRWMAKRLKA